MNIKSIYSQAQDLKQAVAELKQQLDPAFEAKLLLVFASSAYDQQILNQQLHESFAGTAVVGCSTAGEIVSGHMLQNAIVAMAFNNQAIDDFEIQILENIKTEDHVAEAFAAFEQHFGSSMAEMDYNKFVGLVLIDGLTMAEERLMESIGDKTNITFIGGSAGDDLQFKQTNVYANGRAYSNAAVLVLLKPTVGFDFIKTQSFCESVKRLTPTKVDPATRTVIEFNGQPAAQAYAEAVGTEVANLSDYFMSNPVGLMDGNEPFVRSPMQVNDQALAFYCNMVEGMELSLLEPMDIVKDTEVAVQAKLAELGHISGIIDFHCILRTLQLRNEKRTEAYGRIFEAIPTIGFSTYGEEFITHVNQTSTMLVFK
ncbi:MAG: FIST C-terminal domain-containing protein [Candidatus Sericytochromatia bacterium]|nr:FIST C-terminal domain-containing protein [Candidatus Sericytochromatia bacterium]